MLMCRRWSFYQALLYHIRMAIVVSEVHNSSYYSYLLYCECQSPLYCTLSLNGTLILMQKQKDIEAAEAVKMARRTEAMQIIKEKEARPVRMQVGCTPHSSICNSPLRKRAHMGMHGHTLAYGSATTECWITCAVSAWPLDRTVYEAEHIGMGSSMLSRAP